MQDLFSQMLADAGRQGYASARNNDAPAAANANSADAADATASGGAAPSTTADNIAATWQGWISASGYKRYTSIASPQQTLDDFQNIMQQAHQANAYAAPQAFLSQLDPQQLETVQHVHHLAKPIRPGELSLEGSLNLLLPPPAQVDLNNDGLTESGIGVGFRFPDSRTPRAVADAWYETTDSLSFQERATRELQMKADTLFANIHLDENGRYSHTVEPGSPDWVNPMADPDYSYVQKTRQVLSSLEYFKHQTPPEQYARDKAFWTEFQSALLDHQAP